MVRAAVLGLGTYVPQREMTNDDVARLVDTSDQWIVERTGIRVRHIAEPDQAASDLALPASRAALADAGVRPEELDLIICATTTPDMLFPATACILQERLGAKQAAATDLLAACSGFIYGLATATALIGAGVARYVLVVGAEVLSKLVDWTDRTLCVLVGDGAGAAVLGPSRQGGGVLSTVLGADGSAGDILKLPGGGSRLPYSRQVIERRLHYPRMDGRLLFKLAVRVVPQAIETAVRRAHLTLDDVEWIVPHQANQRIIEAVAHAMHLPLERFVCTIERYGNTSAASVPISLWEARRDGRLKAGDHVVLVAFGGGFTWGACVLTWGT
ncbi:MAG: beta-ketoacyl-ACP synthase III [Armatimonadota bacterium]|nr:beta-ketoacyl-ACP synthase III [Armatimonadota bacterium]MDR7426304.1 beta-ketoacyl-ACP synthase III [Armatimonadota bacterium]MDR7463269.1 beta-ketoacyl-ACP synthase III [Armatimonadota bacterium]MDR7470985.1 beta-ketoacyl-ACP synthase III [Armatimonadota bacterium]MDR7474723.1 beta-ketoacyl-ACP synthase III [Armatimonadota bacterium]